MLASRRQPGADVSYARSMIDWDGIVRREERRYADAAARLSPAPAARQKQLVRMANAAAGAGLAELVRGRHAPARRWLGRAAERYRESWEGAPPASWGRPLGALKARLLAGDDAGAEADALWTLGLETRDAESAIGRYAAALAALVLGEDAEASRLARDLEGDRAGFPAEVAAALRGLAEGDAALYARGLELTLRSFETRESYFEDVPVADTVLVLEALAERRGLAVRPESPLLPSA
jgi:hypothetical protein